MAGRDAAIGSGAVCGDVTIRSDQEEMNGTVDVKLDRAGRRARADFYGPLGVAIASFQSDSTQGVLAVGERRYVFSADQKMDSLPFGWGRDLTCGEFMRIVLGQIPLVASEKVCSRQPDSLVKKRNTINTVWKTDTMEIRAETDAKSGRVKKAFLHYKKQTPFWVLKLSSFHNGMAYKIEFTENDGNYFSIHYTKVTLK
jgi:hypothetical protein